MANTQLRAGIVARVSKKVAEGRSVEQQEAGGRSACDVNGWEIAGLYPYTGSASRFARKGNPEWERLQRELSLLNVVVMWEPSRGTAS